MKNSVTLFVTLLILTTLIGCGGGGGSSIPQESAAQIFVDYLNDDPDHEYHVVKATTAQGGQWIVISRGDYNGTQTCINGICSPTIVNTSYYAIDIDKYSNTGYALDYFYANSLGVNFDSGSGLYVDSFGNKYEKQGSVIKDLNVLGAEANAVKQFIYANEIQAKLGLSNERSLTMAKMGMDLQYLAKKNGGKVSDRDAAAFEQFAFGGVKIKSVMEHIQAGNIAALEKDKETIANANGISADDVATLIMQSHF